MTPNNNFSVLPYGTLDEQDRRKWWVYGKIFPLYAPNNRLLPSQLYRDEVLSGGTPQVLTPVNIDEGYSILDDGTIDTSTGEWAVNEYTITGITANVNLCIRYPQMDEDFGGLSVAVFDTDSGTLIYSTDEVDELLYFTIVEADLTGTTATVLIQTKVPSTTSLVKFSGSGVKLPLITELYTAEGKFVKDIWQANLWKGKNVGSGDILATGWAQFNGGYTIPEGQYYIRVSDFDHDWISDVFTVVSNLNYFVKLEWWDEEDFVMDAGTIVYDFDGSQFVNELYLPVDLAKPEYTFEEEGEERDGYFYPTKQLSAKKYKFKMWACEYLLDVMRFIRMSDNIQVTDLPKYWVFSCDTFLITPEWENEGDIASVQVEFTAGTVAKKIGG